MLVAPYSISPAEFPLAGCGLRPSVLTFFSADILSPVVAVRNRNILILTADFFSPGEVRGQNRVVYLRLCGFFRNPPNAYIKRPI